MKFPRRSGILLHPTSLPGRYGIGDLGAAAYQFIDFLSAAGQTYWQVLPLSPTGYADSPYQGLSAFAGNPLLINPDKLYEMGHLSQDELADCPSFPDDRVDFGQVISYKTALFERAFDRFHTLPDGQQHSAFDRFCQEQAAWLDDFTLFMALKEENNLHPWVEWEGSLARREPKALLAWQGKLAWKIERQKYRQWQFYEQWMALKGYANQRGIRIIGDIPIFVAGDSADVWANLRLFHFDKNLHPTVVAGVPPDYFSSTGQLWGNPLYRWDTMAESGYAWWIERFRQSFRLVDVLRVDHFRGFYNYWEVPGSETTAVKGRWLAGPGAPFFRAVNTALGEVAVIAEDLGDFDVQSRLGVDALQAEFGFPGMKILQFAFGDGPTNPFLPYNYTPNYVVYTGTHDNDTSLGWYQHTSSPVERDRARRYLSCDGSNISWDLIRLGWASAANTAITTAQDLLALGGEARMNTPGTCGVPNWCWRVLPGVLDDHLAARLLDLTDIYGRR